MRYYKQLSTKKKLFSLVKDQKAFTEFVLSSKRYYLSKDIKNVLIFSKKLENQDLFLNDIIAAIVKEINSIVPKRWGLYGNDIAHSLLFLEPYLKQEEKNKIIDLLFLNQDMFYSYAKKLVFKTIANFVAKGDDNRIIGSLNNFCRVAEDTDVRNIISKIPNGMDNPGIIKTMEENPSLFFLKYEKYSEDEVNTNDVLRKSIIKDLAKSTSMIKKMPFKIEAKIEDIKGLPPVLRFNFLQSIFKNEIYGTNIITRRYYNYHTIKPTYNNLVVPHINKETMDDFLFAVSLNKTEDVSKWLGTYYKFLEFKESGKIGYT